MFDHEMHQRLAGAATSLAAAMRTAEGLSCRNSSARDEHLQTLLALLEKASDDLHAARSGQPTTCDETLSLLLRSAARTVHWRAKAPSQAVAHRAKSAKRGKLCGEVFDRCRSP
jgi:hypothetical protein